LEETNDSFLVALPTKEITIEGSLFLKEIHTGDEPYIRLMKSGIRAVSNPPKNVEGMYIKILTAKAPHKFPDLLKMVGLEDEDDELSELAITDEMLRGDDGNNKRGELVITDEMLRGDDDEPTLHAGAEAVYPIGMTYELFDTKLKNALETGSLIFNPFKIAS
jgi:hypothetical protein